MTHATQDRVTASDDWFTRSFADDYVKLYAHRDHDEAKQTLHALLDRVAVRADAPCLDLCCGFGRHLLQMRERGLNAYGADLSPELLAIANREPLLQGRLVRMDMRHLPFRPVFDYVFSFFTSFGYFASDAENEGVIQQACSILKPGGIFLIDYLNAPQLRQTLVPEDVQQIGEMQITQRRQIDESMNTITKTISIDDEDGERTYHERVKLYSKADFEGMLQRAGFCIDAVWGDALGNPWSSTSLRLVIQARKAC